jgi:hypothetical protein
VHDLHDLVAGEVLGKNLEVGGFGMRVMGVGLGRCVGRWTGGLGRCDGERAEGGDGEEKGGAKVLGHPVVPLVERDGSNFTAWSSGSVEGRE